MNPGYTQAQFTKIGKRLFYLLGKAFEARQHRYRYERNDVRIVDFNDFNENTSSWALEGVNPSVNTTADGFLYVRCVASGGDWIVTLFKVAGGGAGDRVAVSGVTADGATATFTELNSSGITGTCVLDATVVAEIDDVHRLYCYVDYPVRDVQVFDGTEDKDTELRDGILTSNTQCAALLKQVEDTLLTQVRNLITVYIAERVNSGSTVPIAKNTEVDSGAVSLLTEGILEDLRLAMADNTTVQYVIPTVLSVGTPAFAAGNTGGGTMAAPTMLEKALPGTITLRCNNETIGSETFKVSLRRSDNGEIVDAANDLTIGQAFKDPNIGIASAIVYRLFSKTGDGTNIYLAAVPGASWSVTGETSRNTDEGTLYWKITTNGAAFDISFYKSSSYATGDLVAKATAIANGGVFQASAQRRSGLTVNGTAGSAMANNATGTFLLDPFKSGPPADTITIAITRTSGGEIQKFLAELISEQLDWYLNSNASATLPDSLMTAGITTLYGKN